MQVIAISGAADTGKSSTLNLFYDPSGNLDTADHCLTTPIYITSSLFVNVAIWSTGDDADAIERGFAALHMLPNIDDIDFFVIACRSRDTGTSSKSAVIELAGRYGYPLSWCAITPFHIDDDYHSDSVSPDDIYRLVNTERALRLRNHIVDRYLDLQWQTSHRDGSVVYTADVDGKEVTARFVSVDESIYDGRLSVTARFSVDNPSERVIESLRRLVRSRFTPIENVAVEVII